MLGEKTLNKRTFEFSRNKVKGNLESDSSCHLLACFEGGIEKTAQYDKDRKL